MRVSILAGGLLLVAASLGDFGAWRNALDLGLSVTVSAAETGVYPASPSASASDTPEPCDVTYYRNPMGLPDISDVPKKDNMGMDYIAVCAEESGPGIVVSPGRQQSLGVTLVQAKRQDLIRQIEAPGLVEVNQRRVSVVAPRVEGWIEELLVNATGDTVAQGAPRCRRELC